MSKEAELQKLKKDLEKSRAEIAALQKKLQASILKRNTAADNSKPRQRPS